MDDKLGVAHLKSLIMDYELYSVWDGPTDVALLKVKGGQELQHELLVCRLLDGKECVPSAKGNEVSDLYS